MSENTSNIKVISLNNDLSMGIFNFENCKFRSKSLIEKYSSCCSSKKVSGYYCSKINKFPVNFSIDCQNCKYFQK